MSGSDEDPGDIEAYLPLARLIHDEVRRFADDPSADVESLARALDAIPQTQRRTLALSVFEGLPPRRRWEVLERLFGDDELREHLAAEREAVLAEVRRDGEAERLAWEARAAGSLDTAALPAGVRIEIGLFRPEDVTGAVPRGRASSVVARLLVLRAEGAGGDTEPGRLRVLDDIFNPAGGLFVTPEYDRDVWQHESLAGHRLVRVGSPGPDGTFTPVLFAEARVDVELDGEVRPGRLHLGYLVIGGSDVFAGPG